MFKAFIVFIVISSSLAQKKASEKCFEYVNERLDNRRNVVGGSKTADNEFPHMAAMGYSSQRRPLWLCGGTLISDQYVLTAAHCTSHPQLGQIKVVRLGTRTLTPRRNHNYTDIRVDKIIRHPDYRSPSSYNDIALVKLQQKVHFSKSILPACLNLAFNVNVATKTLLAIGWGKTDFAGPTSDDLLKVRLRVVYNGECSRIYRNASKEKLPHGIKQQSQLCAGGELQRDTCQGDSGGPLEYKNGKIHYIIGLTSFGRACGLSTSPGVYTRVSAFVPWIESQVWS